MQGEGYSMLRVTYLRSPITLSILDGIGRGHFQEVENPSHISCGQYPLGRTAVTDRGLFSVQSCHAISMRRTYSGGPPTVLAPMWWGRQGGIGHTEVLLF
jgi:hypothetical protein